MRALFLIGISLLLVGCGSSRKEWVSQYCNEAGGYELGQRDSNHGRKASTRTLEKCPHNLKKETQKGYVAGYKTGPGFTKHGYDKENHKEGHDMFRDLVYHLNKPSRNKKKAEEPTDQAEGSSDL